MKLIIILFFFSGIIMVIHGIYREQLNNVKSKVKVEYRFVPRSQYDEATVFEDQFSTKFANIFEQDDGWYNRSIGKDMNINRMNNIGNTKQNEVY